MIGASKFDPPSDMSVLTNKRIPRTEAGASPTKPPMMINLLPTLVETVSKGGYCPSSTKILKSCT